MTTNRVAWAITLTAGAVLATAGCGTTYTTHHVVHHVVHHHVVHHHVIHHHAVAHHPAGHIPAHRYVPTRRHR